jgi:branched-subunit amino acid aminotransferase/4-amino-4-deoxychorismate lyase
MSLLAVAVEGRGLVAPDAPVFGAGDEALLRGSAAFETIRLRRGRPLFLDLHLARLSDSALALRLPSSDGATELAAAAVEAAGADEGMLRVFRTSETLVASVAPLPPELDALRARGLLLLTFEAGISPFLAGVKATSYAFSMAALAEAERRGADDALFLGPGRAVLDATTSNVWWRDGDVLTTPTPGPAVLPGVTRRVLADLARDAGFRVREGSFTLGQLLGAEEAFTSSAVREVMPVVAVDGRRLGNGRPGEVAARLQSMLEAL